MRCSAAPLPLLAVLLACAPAALAGGGPLSRHDLGTRRAARIRAPRRRAAGADGADDLVLERELHRPGSGETYPFSMVGADPRSGRTTTVPTEIVPLRLNFVAGRQDTQGLAQP